MRPKSALSRASTLITVSASCLGGCFLDSSDPPLDITTADAHSYRITAIDLPETSDQARAMAVDLDGDDVPDNRLGAVYSTMRQVYTSFELEAPAAARLTSDLGWVVTIYDAGAAGAGVRISRGVFQGDALVPVTSEAAPSLGDALGRGFVLRGGTTVLPLGTISDPSGTAVPGWQSSLDTGVTIDAWTGVDATATIGVALSIDDVRGVVYPNLAAYFTTKLADPDAWFPVRLDVNGDGTITVDELAQDSLIRSLFAPDLAGDQISLGLQVRAAAL